MKKDVNVWKVPMMQPEKEKEKHECSTETLTHRNPYQDVYVCLCGKEWDGLYVAEIIHKGKRNLDSVDAIRKG